ncbi:MAG: hypothetical protein V3T05_04435, partial [Myxococcota bacterium]
ERVFHRATPCKVMWSLYVSVAMLEGPSRSVKKAARIQLGFYFDWGHKPSFPRPDGSILPRDTSRFFRVLAGAKNRLCPSAIEVDNG